MAVYTTLVKTICENAYLQKIGSIGPKSLWGVSPDVVIDTVADEVLNFTFPVWEGITLHDVKVKILTHFYMREIGLETVALWGFYMKRELQEHMPWIVEMYNEKLKMGDIFKTHDISFTENVERDKGEKTTVNLSENTTGKQKDVLENTVSGTRGNVSSGTETRTDDTHAENQFSDTPQDGLSGVLTGNYLTSVTLDSNTNSVDVSTTGKIDETSSTTGNQTNNKTTDNTKTNTGTNQVDVNESETRSHKTEGNQGNKVDVWEQVMRIHFNALEMVMGVVNSCFISIL